MHWGHAVSEDLIHWEHLGVALFPTKRYDQNGVFSGSALEHDGRMYLYYTGIHYKEADPKNIHACVGDDFQACQLMISSEDGMSFNNFSGKRVVVPVIVDEETGDPKDTRDPKVWQEDGNFYMILGSTYRKETGRAVIYKSRDGENWEYASQLRSSRFGRIPGEAGLRISAGFRQTERACPGFPWRTGHSSKYLPWSRSECRPGQKRYSDT